MAAYTNSALSDIPHLAGLRSAGAIIVAYIASTVMVIVWLVFTIEITLQENEEDARGVASPGRTAELIKVCCRPVSVSVLCVRP